MRSARASSGWKCARIRAKVLAAQAGERGGPADARWLARATAWVAEVAPDWEELTGRVPPARTWMPLVDEPDLQGWLICWPSGQARALHGHDGAAGALQILRGGLDERWAPRPGAPLTPRRLQSGICYSFGPEFLHAVGNSQTEPATSVHFYGRAVAVPPAMEVAGAGAGDAMAVVHPQLV